LLALHQAVLQQFFCCAGSILSENADGSPISLDTLKLLLTRESVTEPPQVRPKT
jgi:hypothetical protein